MSGEHILPVITEERVAHYEKYYPKQMKEQSGVETHWFIVILFLVLLALFAFGFLYMMVWMRKHTLKPTTIILEPRKRVPKKKFVINKVV